MHILNIRKQKWLDFYTLDGQTRFMLLANYPKTGRTAPPLWYEKSAERVEWAYAEWQAAMEETHFVADDLVPSLNMLTGTEVFAEALGCQVHYPADNNPFALPCIHSAADVARLKPPRWQDTRLATLFEMADKLRALAGPEAIFRLPDIQSPLDIAALIWDKNTFYPALIEEAAAVHDLIAVCKTLLFSFLDDWFARYGVSFVAHYPDYYMEKGLSFSEDEIGVISPAMFRAFALPTLVEMAEHFGPLGMHCCADSQRQWPNFRRIPNLRLLNLNRPQPEALKSWKFFSDHVALYPVPSAEDSHVESWPGLYPKGTHAVLQFTAANRQAARETLGRLHESIAELPKDE